MEQTKRMDNLDLMKALGILMVITIHVPLWKPEFMETDSVGRLVQYAFRIISEGVPIFVTINGLLLLKKKNGWPCFTVPDGIGGRFSVFSQVGLVFAMLWNP